MGRRRRDNLFKYVYTVLLASLDTYAILRDHYGINDCGAIAMPGGPQTLSNDLEDYLLWPAQEGLLAEIGEDPPDHYTPAN